MRGWPLVLLLLLATCGQTASGPSASQSGDDAAQAALRGGSPQTALQLASGVLAHSPENEAALVIQGDALAELGRLDEAQASYRRALQSNPASAGAEVGLGRLRLSDDPAAAEQLFLKALKDDPRSTAALNDLGVARDLRSNHAGAQDAYRQALAIDSEDSAAEVNLALSMAMSGSPKDAVRILRPIASAPGASRKVRHDLAAVLAMAGDRDEAARILGKDLSETDVQQALNDYVAAGRAGADASLVQTPRGGEAGVALTPLPAASGSMQVQFAAVPTESAAQVEWQRLQEQMPALLSGRQPMFIKVERHGQTFWRVRTGGFANAAQASVFCHKVQAAAGTCVVGDP
jgi:Flp pilus assembly protein TadD